MTNRVIIRQSNIDDWQVIQRLNLEVFEASKDFDPYLDLMWPLSKRGIESYKNDVSNPNMICFVAEIDRKPVGYLVGCERKVDYRKVKIGEIDHMGVSPKFRSWGVGSKLVEKFRDWCRNQGFSKVYVSAYPESRSVNFYKKQGLTPMDLGLEGNV